MSVKLSELAKKTGLTSPELRKKITELGFELKKGARTVEDDLAELISEELSGSTTAEKSAANEETLDETPPTEPESKAELYDQLIEKEMQKEIIKKQRRQTAGKDKPGEKPSKEEPDAKLETPKKSTLQINDTITVKELAEKSGISAARIIGELMKNGILANINQSLDFETASIVAAEFDLKLRRQRGTSNVKDLLERNLQKMLEEDDPSDLKSRPPIISIMGHVDHGKTKLLDAIREANVVDSEAGGITQHIGAYQVKKNNKLITFLDTPGHEAFTAMRARGAQATDIAILVVAADEGVKPQTIEAINHAKEAGIPIIVAINKIDKPDANPDKVKQELSQEGLQPEEWSGDTVMVPVSAISHEGLDNLLDTILIVAELANLKANPDRLAIGTVIEAHLNHNLGPTATILVNTGTLKLMDNIIVGAAYGRLKVMQDHNNKKVKKALPATPVRIAGLSRTPQAGDILQVVTDEKTAKNQALQISDIEKLARFKAMGLKKAELSAKISSGEIKTLKIVLKTDTKGSLEAITQSLAKIKSENVFHKIIHSGVGNITESDILMASASQGIVIGFHVQISAQVKKLAERENIDVSHHTIIYKLIEEITNILKGLLEPEEVIVELGQVKIKEVFLTSKKYMIVGGLITQGKIENETHFKVLREEEEIGQGEILNLKSTTENVKELEEKNECGLKINTPTKIQPEDILAVYKTETRTRTL